MTDEERQRIRSYLQAQGSKLSPPELVEKVRAAMDELRTALDAVPAARFLAPPASGEWSANDVMGHVVQAGAHFGGNIMRVLEGGAASPAVADGIEAGAPAHTAAEWWDLLAADRARLFEGVLHADPGAHLDRAIGHPMFGPLSWRETLLFLRLHDLDHAGQLRKIAAASA
jgi:uncharacterized damage-inducible protein DinB